MIAHNTAAVDIKYLKSNDMAEKEEIELLIQSYGLDPFGVEKYDVKSNKTSESGQGWRGKGIDENNDVAISFCEPEGFNAAIAEIKIQALSLSE